MTRDIAVGIIPLLDAAPPIIARELGFAEEEGLALTLTRATSWSMLRDLLDVGQVEAAQMLSVMPVARVLGLGGGRVPLETALVLTLNGQVMGVSEALGRAMGPVPFADPVAAGAALADLTRPLRIGVPFPFSMHTELLHYWLAAAAPQARVEIRTIPPPRMSEALLADDIDGFCVGEPWGSHAVTHARARLILPGAAIWSQSPEKVLATRTDWADDDPDTAGRLFRAVWRAARWCADPENRVTLSEILARPAYLDVQPELLDRGLSGRLLTRHDGQEQPVEQFLTFHQGAANFPWRSQAAWIGTRLADRFGLPRWPSIEAARPVFRSDLYRHHLRGTGAPMPKSSERVEGSLDAARSVPAVHGSLDLERNRFFDGQIFDPQPGN